MNVEDYESQGHYSSTGYAFHYAHGIAKATYEILGRGNVMVFGEIRIIINGEIDRHEPFEKRFYVR